MPGTMLLTFPIFISGPYNRVRSQVTENVDFEAYSHLSRVVQLLIGTVKNQTQVCYPQTLTGTMTADHL